MLMAASEGREETGHDQFLQKLAELAELCGSLPVSCGPVCSAVWHEVRSATVFAPWLGCAGHAPHRVAFPRCNIHKTRCAVSFVRCHDAVWFPLSCTAKGIPSLLLLTADDVVTAGRRPCMEACHPCFHGSLHIETPAR